MATIGTTDQAGLRYYDTQGNAVGYFATKQGNTLEVYKTPSKEHEGENKYSMYVRVPRPQGEDLTVLMYDTTLVSPDYFINLYRERY